MERVQTATSTIIAEGDLFDNQLELMDNSVKTCVAAKLSSKEMAATVDGTL